MTWHLSRAFLPFVLLMCLFCAGCEKKMDKQTEEITNWIPPEIPEMPFYDPEPLVIQVSKATVVYVSHIPARPDDNNHDGPNPDDEIIVMPSDLDDLAARIEQHKTTQDVLKKDASILLCGDDYATCDSVIAVINGAKRAGIQRIIFETNYWRTGRIGFKVAAGGCIILQHTDIPKIIRNNPKSASNLISITILENDIIMWGKETVTLDNFVSKLHDYAIKVGQENALVITDVEAKTSYPALRYVLDQIKRCGIQKVMVRLREAR